MQGGQVTGVSNAKECKLLLLFIYKVSVGLNHLFMNITLFL